MSRKITTEIFIERAKNTHGNKYDYSKVDYKGKDTKVCIICPEHGEFWQTPHNHYKHGCSKCGVEVVSQYKQKTTEDFIRKSKEIYKDKFKYDNTKYIDSKTLLKITCPIHGDVEVYPGNFLNGRGCPKCGQLLKGQYKKLNTETFIEKANIIHNNRYNYNKTNYKLSHEKVIIICPIHGEFTQTPNHHLNGEGCPICSQSKGERLVESILLKYNIPFEREITYKVNDIVKNKKEFRIDFVIKLNNRIYFIEYNGKQHYEPNDFFGGQKEFELQQKRDNYVRGFVNRHKDKISLLEISYKLKEMTVENKILKFLNIAPSISNDSCKQEELLEACDGNQQPSWPLTKPEGSETNS